MADGINIGGRTVPYWAIGAGALGAIGLFLISRMNGGGGDSAGGGTTVEEQSAYTNLSNRLGEIEDEMQGTFNAQNKKIADVLTAQNALIAKNNTDLLAMITSLFSRIGGGTVPTPTPTPTGGTVFPPTGKPITIPTRARTGDWENITVPPAVTFAAIAPSRQIGASEVQKLNYAAYVSSLQGSPTKMYNTGNYNIQVLMQGNSAIVAKYRGETGVFSGDGSDFISAIRVPRDALGLNEQRGEATVPSYLDAFF